MTNYEQAKMMKQSIVRIVKLYAGRERRMRGDKFATIKEMKAICSDPLGWMELLKGEDAFDVLRYALRFDDCRY